jgi:predicted phage terminase large subunit-like protein
VSPLRAAHAPRSAAGEDRRASAEGGSVLNPTRELIRAEVDRRRAREDADRLAGDLRAFVKDAWKALKPAETYLHNWHIDAICDHLQAVSRGEIKFLQIWVPRGTMKSLNVSVMWPAWEWTTNPWLRYWTGSYELGLAQRLAGQSRNLMQSPWYQHRWGDVFHMLKEGERYFSNDQGGTRLATAPGSTALGEHGHRILIDDPINAAAADATSRAVLDSTNEWYDGSVQGSKADPKAAAEVIIMQRLHENDLAGHAYEQDPDSWTILCLPERYEHDHPHRWHLDPRTVDGELLWPNRRGDVESDRMAKSLGPYRRAGQMQQRPAAREGDLLKRYWWRFYHPELFTDDRMKKRRPRFAMIVISVDTPLKDKEVNDLVAIQAWGVAGADRYLLDIKKGHMSKEHCKRAIAEMSRYVRDKSRFGQCSHKILVEKAGYGPELIAELKREWTGTEGLSRTNEGDKEVRADAASGVLESGNCFLPGYRDGADEMSMPDDDRNSADITSFIDDCAGFPNARFDDQVDAWSQCMNWLTHKPIRRARVYSPFS